MTPPNVRPEDDHPDPPRPATPEATEPDLKPEAPAARYVRCPMLACGRLHEIADPW
ncbi:hypothetical protein EES47_07450 [Streptomyces sp. ADI98-12]|uniref:Uncharacterized protein n=1 Tax=Streptomyces gougerotii TaxID=53448 RepID=A0A8H9HWM3_9ACTN|nr:hypothetical protein EES47_07450 [Streptomyces sp. ADI98-12]GGU83440.1 hypothetical protein GCM10010227_42150 [Streptomyces gougerotii]